MTEMNVTRLRLQAQLSSVEEPSRFTLADRFDSLRGAHSSMVRATLNLGCRECRFKSIIIANEIAG